ncbi:MAG TPA: N-acetylmuramoyl-L-alanine amidase [Chloroflexota bacterium]|nr:N-acetylmuramoyl-L-alanine amidase [Chloroflexota bacterium]
MFEDFGRALAERGRRTPETLAARISRRSFTFGVGTVAAAVAVVAGARGAARTNVGDAPASARPTDPAPTATPRPIVAQAALAAPVSGADTSTPEPAGHTDAEAGPDGATPEAGPPSTGPNSGTGRGGFRDQGTPLPLVGYAGATWIPSPYHRRRTQTVDTLVMHTTVGTLQSAVGEFQHSSRRVSAHYVVGRAGQIIQMVSENQIAFHAGVVTAGPDSRFSGTNPNAYSIGIEMENLDVISSPADFPAAQRDAVFKLARDVVQRNHIPLDRQHIVGHSEIDPADRTDPGPGFPWSDFMKYLAG